MTRPDIAALAREFYGQGTPPLVFAEANTVLLIGMHRNATERRAEDPGACPSYIIELTDNGLARKILGDLLAAGWSMPSPEWESDEGGSAT